jgi:hypothetical protein
VVPPVPFEPDVDAAIPSVPPVPPAPEAPAEPFLPEPGPATPMVPPVPPRLDRAVDVPPDDPVFGIAPVGSFDAPDAGATIPAPPASPPVNPTLDPVLDVPPRDPVLDIAPLDPVLDAPPPDPTVTVAGTGRSDLASLNVHQPAPAPEPPRSSVLDQLAGLDEVVDDLLPPRRHRR